MKRMLFLFTLLFTVFSNAQTAPTSTSIYRYVPPAPPGINNKYTYVDDDSDGYVLFDLNYYTQTYIRTFALVQMNMNLSGYSITAYATQIDRTNSTNELPAFYTNTITHLQAIYIKLTYVGAGPIYDQTFLNTTFGDADLIVLTRFGDNDNDGILNYLEDANGNLNLFDDDSDNDSIPNYEDTTNSLNLVTFNKNNFIISPNPATTFLNIKFDTDLFQNGTISVFDNLGKKVLENTLSEKTDISQLKSGIYFVSVQSNNQTSTEKLIVK